LRARGILVESLLPSYSDRLTEMEKVLTTAVALPSGKLKIGSPSSSDSDDESIPSFGRKKGTGFVFAQLCLRRSPRLLTACYFHR